jgi:acetolactate synthase I/II/III large subunit
MISAKTGRRHLRVSGSCDPPCGAHDATTRQRIEADKLIDGVKYMKLSDFIMAFLASKGVKHVFLLSGGGMMHLLDSVGKCKDIEYVCNLHEQAASICAEAYGQVTGKPGVCMVTTGPGGTNAITGVAAAWTDSTPMLVISGQVKRSDLSTPKNVRQYGLQEINITSIVEPITKYAAIVLDPNEIRYHLEKAWYLASTGRKGPCWIDVPLDVQAAQIDENSLNGFDPAAEGLLEANDDNYLSEKIQQAADMILQSKRPLFFIGHGVVAAFAEDRFVKLAERMKIPVLTTWRAKTVFDSDDPLFFGHPGSPAHRAANFILQNCDCLISIGTRLSPGVTAYNEAGFAPTAKKIMVDLDAHEIDKLSMKIDLPIVADAGAFIDTLSTRFEKTAYHAQQEWLNYCNGIREKYPAMQDYQQWDYPEVNPYLLVSMLTGKMSRDDNLVASSSGRACGVTHLAANIKHGQRFYSSMGFGAMGFSLPAAIGVCIATGRRRTVATDGDGGLQMNSQELETIARLDLPVNLLVFNNGCYGSIVSMQERIFEGRMTGSEQSSGVILPDLKKLADAYQIAYLCISNNSEIAEGLDRLFKSKGPVLCDIKLPKDVEEYPRTLTKVTADGNIVSTNIADLWPFLSEEEVKSNMIYNNTMEAHS